MKIRTHLTAPGWAHLPDEPRLYRLRVFHEERRILYTGTNLETVRELARKGTMVVIGARNLDKAAAAEAELRRELPDAQLEVRELDLSSLASIKAFAVGVLARHDGIDLLFNNAGVMATPERQTEDGFEMQFGTNHLGHFYLTYLLLPALLRAGPARVITTTSTARFTAGHYDLTNPHMRGEYKPWVAYGYSKRANLHFAIELNQRLAAAGSAVAVLAADPGFSNTDLQAAAARNSGGRSQRMTHAMVQRLGQSPAAGALPQLRAGTDPSARGGTLYRPQWITRGAPVVGKIGPRLRKPSDLVLLWDVSERETGITFDVAEMVGSVGR